MRPLDAAKHVEISRENDVSRLLQMGQDARERGAVLEALACFERALQIEPHNIEALRRLGYQYLNVYDYAKAWSYFEKALAHCAGREPTGTLLYGAAIALENLQRNDAALSYANRLIDRKDPESRCNGHLIAGRIRYSRGEFGAAVEELTQAISLGRRKARRIHDARLLLAETYIALGEPNKALRHLRKAITKEWSAYLEEQRGHLFLQIDRPREAEKSFQRVLEQSPDNRRALLGLGRAHVAGQHYDRAIHAFEQVLEISNNDPGALDGLIDAYRGKRDLDKAAEYARRLGANHRLLQVPAENRLNAIARERQLRDAELLRMRTIASLNVMATGIAHELRQPLTAIRLIADNACHDLHLGHSDIVARDLESIDQEIDKIDRVIHLLRDMSAASTGDATIVMLEKAVERALELFRRQLRNRSIDIHLHDLNHKVLAEESGLLQILVNLISNAQDAVAVTESRILEIWAVSGPNRVSLFVRDTGEGMSKSTRQQALMPFFTTKGSEGIGVGLYISYNIARKMHGQLSIKQSQPGKGTTIELSLPRAKPHGSAKTRRARQDA